MCVNFVHHHCLREVSEDTLRTNISSPTHTRRHLYLPKKPVMDAFLSEHMSNDHTHQPLCVAVTQLSYCAQFYIWLLLTPSDSHKEAARMKAQVERFGAGQMICLYNTQYKFIHTS